MDVFVANDQARNFLLKNVEGQRFTEIGVEAGVAYSEDGLPLSSMGVDFRDLNDDGRPDLIVTALAQVSGLSAPRGPASAENIKPGAAMKPIGSPGRRSY